MFLFVLIRHLSGEIVTAWNDLDEDEDSSEGKKDSKARREQLVSLVKSIVPSQVRQSFSFAFVNPSRHRPYPYLFDTDAPPRRGRGRRPADGDGAP